MDYMLPDWNNVHEYVSIHDKDHIGKTLNYYITHIYYFRECWQNIHTCLFILNSKTLQLGQRLVSQGYKWERVIYFLSMTRLLDPQCLSIKATFEITVTKPSSMYNKYHIHTFSHILIMPLLLLLLLWPKLGRNWFGQPHAHAYTHTHIHAHTPHTQSIKKYKIKNKKKKVEIISSISQLWGRWMFHSRVEVYGIFLILFTQIFIL